MVEPGDNGGVTLTTPLARHRARAPRRALLAAGVAVGAVVLIGVAVGAASGAGDPVETSSLTVVAADRPPSIEALPVPLSNAAPQAAAMCDLPSVSEALNAGDSEGAVAAAGGGAALRAAVVSGKASCIDLSTAGAVWFVVNKMRPFPQADWAPGDLVKPEGVASFSGDSLDRKAAIALETMAAAMEVDGAGAVSLASGYRSYQTQADNHAGQVSQQGEDADKTSARAGFSEHQTGLAADLIACDASGCGTLDGFGATQQGQWVAANGWQFGWIIRYEAGQTAVTGYDPEPWHLRYVGRDLARAYHDGGFRSLEAFFGLPAAPGYAG